MADPQTPDQQRLGNAETDIGVLKSNDLAFAKLLDGIVTTQKELKASSYPPFSDVLRNIALGAALMTSILAGSRYLNGAQIDEATKVMEYRLAKLENAIVWQARFADVVIVKEGK